MASEDVFIKLLQNTNVIKTLDNLSKIAMWIVWNLDNVSSDTCQFPSLAKTFNFYKILLNYPNQLSVSKNSSGNVKKSIFKHENASF